MELKKGDVVTVNAIVYTRYGDGLQGLHETLIHYAEDWGTHHPGKMQNLFRGARQAIPWRGLIVGKSHRVTGTLVDPGSENDLPYLMADKVHPVWLVEPLDAQRWIKPAACLEEDLELWAQPS